MKKSTLLLALLSNILSSNACSWWPDGESVRFSLFAPNLGGQDDLAPLFYSSEYFSSYQSNLYLGPAENLDEWQWFFGHNFSSEEIDEVVYSMKLGGDYKAYRENPLFSYLENNNHVEAKTYLIFAKQVEILLDFDPWVKKKYDADKLLKAQKIAQNKAKNCIDSRIRFRYAYQFITISYYLNDYANVKLGYNVYFENNSSSVLKYWAMLYYANVQDSNINRLYLYSIIFTHSKSKCKYIYNHFTDNDSIINLVLEKCKTDEEKAGVLSILAFKNPGPALDQITEVTELNAQSDLIDILLIREINKIEDWFLTKRYTSYDSEIYYESNWSDNAQIKKQNLVRDKKYLIRFLKECKRIVKEEKPKNRSLWHTSIAYLHFMLNHQSKSEKFLQLALSEYPTPEVEGQIKVISVLNLVANSSKWDNQFQNVLYRKLIELKEVKDNIINYDDFYDQLMMALSRQFLEKKNVVIAALFEGKNESRIDGYVHWYDSRKKVFNLLDAETNSKDLDEFFELWNKPNKTALEHYLIDSLGDYKWEFTDLWGTQYLREDNLERALEIYETIPNEFWTERDTVDMIYHHLNEFTSDPFESTFFGYHLYQKSDVHYTKPQFVKRILKLKKELNNGSATNPAHTALLLGNAYYNMTVNGNSPYYSEYFMYSYKSDELGRKNDYFYNCSRALEYYKQAEKLANNDVFGAFCYRMIVKCSSQSDFYQEYAYGYNGMKIGKNIWSTFAKKYPKHYKKLTNCDHFEYYSNAWKP